MASKLGGMWALADLLGKQKQKGTSTTAIIHHVDGEGVTWVSLSGLDEPVPVNGTSVASAAPGDMVAVSIADGRLNILGNATAPSVSSTYVQQVLSPVDEKADQAIGDAKRAKDAADTAESEAERAKEAADEAQSEAERAHRAADNAQSEAERAREKADEAADSAADAKNSATRANTAANDALVQLSNVQDVIGTVTWLAEHGTYELTQDTHVDPDKTYYVRVLPMDGYVTDSYGNRIMSSDGNPIAIASMAHTDGWLYIPVAEPVDAALGAYYELTVDEAMSRYVASHLALTDKGLWVLKDDTAYKLLVAADGVLIVDPAGHTVVRYGESIVFDSERPQYIGGEDAYIVYYDADDDGKPDSIIIGGKNVRIGTAGKTLTEILGDIEQASSDASAAKSDASAAVETANNTNTMSITSTNGTVFKNDRGTSTTFEVKIFTGDGDCIQGIQKLRARYGIGAYLQWRWKDVGMDDYVTLLVTDPRISRDGFALTVTPADISTQATVQCQLIY